MRAPPRSTRPAFRALIALAVIALLGHACSDPAPDVLVESVHDLYARFKTTEVTSGELTESPPVQLFRLIYLDNKVDDRDAIASIHAPTETLVTWHDLATHGEATLTFGCGVVPLANDPQPTAVRFLIEGRDALVDGSPWETLFDHTLAPADLPDVRSVERHELQLPARPTARWSLRFSTTAVGTARVVQWPGWFEPVVRSDGRRVPRVERPVIVPRVYEDLLASLDRAEVLEENPDSPVSSGAFDAAFEVPVFGGRRTLVSATAPSRVRWDVDVPPEALLDFVVGMDTEQGWKLPGDGMTFAVEIDGDRIWELRIDPHNVKSDRGWHLASIDLSPWAGTQVGLTLSTETGADAANDVGGWGNLRIMGRSQSRRLAKGERPNVFVIVMDTLRADRFGSYGNSNDLTPRMDALAAEGVLFERARTVASYTWPSTASIFTGLYPHAHGVLGNGQAYLVDRVETLAELFTDAGYTTGAFVANPLISHAGNFQQGFETFVNAPSVRARALNERVDHWIDEQVDSALFTYVHYFDPHNPYNAPPGHEPGEDAVPDYTQQDVASVPHLEATYQDVVWDKKQIRDFQLQNNQNLRDYDAEVVYMDTAVGELIDGWRARGLLDDALIVVLSDHGEEFFEHGRPFHGPNLYDESLHIPLWITGFGPSALEPAVVERSVHVTDILPTLIELTGVPGPRTDPAGSSLLSKGRDEPQYFLSMNGEEVGIEGMTEKLSIYVAPWKLIQTPASGRVELYRLDLDPGELDDLADVETDVRDRLLETLEDWLTAALRDSAGGTGVSPEQSWWLQQLGYVDR